MTNYRRIMMEEPQQRPLSGPLLDLINIVLIARPILGTFYPPAFRRRSSPTESAS